MQAILTWSMGRAAVVIAIMHEIFKTLDERFKQPRNFFEDKIIGPIIDFLVPPWVKPDYFCYLRIFLAIPINYYIFFHRDMELARDLFAGAWVTDYLDGVLARRRGQETKFGAALDPAADKILIVSILGFALYFTIGQHPELRSDLVANVVVESLIFVTATIARKRIKDVEIKSNFSGKGKLGFQCVGILMIVYENFSWAGIFLRVAFWLGLVSFISYLAANIRKHSTG
jgi:CDP-diacylglycerol---glycerol-3-phosphate 3-phosphatidyltransferase